MSVRCAFNWHRWAQFGPLDTLTFLADGHRIAVEETCTDDLFYQRRSCMDCGVIELQRVRVTQPLFPRGERA